ncbi:uncharacterized protein L199_006337 [Kwoniella botswanensis]|uniref:uncharacterized protein n=1 Tax=Kwoniella botswanensis TaxID=1268659 RepID=UPI00315D24D7
MSSQNTSTIDEATRADLLEIIHRYTTSNGSMTLLEAYDQSNVKSQFEESKRTKDAASYADAGRRCCDVLQELYKALDKGGNSLNSAAE